MKYYIFYIMNGNNVYERTCGNIIRAEERISELKYIYDNAEYFINEIPKNYKWYY